MEALEEVGDLGGGDAGAGVGDRELGVIPGEPQADGDLPLEGELEGVGEEVEEDLLPHLGVDVDLGAEQRAVHLEAEPGPFDSGGEGAREVGGENREVGGSKT